ncbi:unnamed protein product, partial [Coregonus sp. 'balchen']
MINVHRGNVLNSSLHSFQRQNFNTGAKLDVAFVDVESKVEGAVDQGGPSREYYRLLMRDIRDLAIFEGPEGVKRLSLDVHAVCGKPAPPLSPEEVSHTTLRAHLDNVKNKFEESVDWLSLLGLKMIIFKTMEDRDVVVELVAQQFVKGSMQVALEQFKYDLNTLGLLEALGNHPDSFRALFMDPIKPPTARDLRDMFKVTYSIPFNWLAEVQDGECPPLTVAMVLEFATGATVVPTLGFEETPTIEFLHTARG